MSIAFNRVCIYDAVNNEKISSNSFSEEVEPIFGLHASEDWGRWSNGNLVSFVIRYDFSCGMKRAVITHSLHPLCLPTVYVKARINARMIFEGNFLGGKIEFFFDLAALGPHLMHDGDTKRKAVTVLGMHRSGTSAMARVLSLAGGRLPNRLMSRAADNQEGFWESANIAALNDKLLHSARSSWLDVFAWRRIKNLSHSAKQLIVDVVEQEYSPAEIIIVKDPRISLIKHLWNSALLDASYISVPIIMVRNPLEVAASLYRRNRISLEHSLLLWASYTVSAYEHDGPSSDASFILYDELLSDPMAALDRFNERVGSIFATDDKQVRSAVRGFVREELSHKAEKNLNFPPAFSIVENLFVELSKTSINTRDISRAIIECREWLISMDEVFGPVLSYYANDYMLHA